jgi:TRAP-type transport system small permease protein
MSRYFFVWLTFIGAVLTFREHGISGSRPGPALRPPRAAGVCMALTNVIILVCMGVCSTGHLAPARHQRHDDRAGLGLSMIWVFGIAYFTGARHRAHRGVIRIVRRH